MSKRRGFTLIELLVVVAVMAVVAALMLPAIQAARAAARRSVCASNMRQVGLGVLNFASARGGRFPKTTHTADGLEQSWIYTIAPFLEGVDQIRICPSDPRGEERLEGNLTSYVLNGYVTYEAYGSILRLDRLPSTSETIIAFEASDRLPLSTYNEHTHAPGWYRSWIRDKELVWEKVVDEIQVDRHGPGSHYLYADGHVALITSEEIRDWVEEGHEFARPPQ